jgi:hypothetical protein
MRPAGADTAEGDAAAPPAAKPGATRRASAGRPRARPTRRPVSRTRSPKHAPRPPPRTMAVDLTVAFHVCLYTLCLESLLFFAVVMQTKTAEPGTHGGTARCFGLVFFFQALGSFFLVLSEQLYEGYLSLYCSILSVICIFLAVIMCIPAAAHVVVPEAQRPGMKTLSVVAWVLVVCLCTFVVSTKFSAGPDIPYMTHFLRRELLGAIIGALLILAVAAFVRMLRQLKGRNGAFILLAGLTLIMCFGVVWMHFEPLCAQTGPSREAWPRACPLPRAFDHNVLFTVLLMVANVLSAEGVLRLMAAGSGAEGYAEIISVS